MNDAAENLAQGFAHHIVQWAQRRGCDNATIQVLAAAAKEVALATDEGHVCASIDAAQRPWLLSSGLVGTPDAPGAMPLILDADDRLYLHRYFDDERRLALRLLDAVSSASVPAGDAARAVVEKLFAGHKPGVPGRDDPQKRAALLALEKRLLIISGGPGTGKTSTVVRLLAGLLTQNPALRIALTAPTGKARARLLEAMQQPVMQLPESARERLPAEASTLHRLLGARPDGSYSHHAGNPLPIDVLIVDEASMLSLALARRLFEALPENAHIILLGDKDQLASVESGAVFAEISAAQGELKDSVVWFRDNYRFAADSALGRLAADISGARADAALDSLRHGEDPNLRWLEDNGSALSGAAIDYLLAAFEPYFHALRRDIFDRESILTAFGRFRVLCAIREGARGVDRVNDLLDARARSHREGTASPWYPGRPVIVTRNDYALNLMNGDVGIALPDREGSLSVFFADGEGGPRGIAPARMPPHETAFASTVHKAQGSEYDEVMLILPERRIQVLTRELLYTAVTRARGQVTLCASEAMIRTAIDSPTRRFSGLRARLKALA